MGTGVLAVAGAAALLAAVACAADSAAAAGRGPAAAPKCPRGSVAARIGGKRTCLRPGQRCRRTLDARYHRKRFHCHGGRLVRVTVAEARWTARVRAWARGYRSDVTDSLAFVPDWLGQRSPESLAQLDEFATVLRGCKGQLDAFGGPTRRFRTAYALFARGCARFAAAADDYARLVLEVDASLPVRAKAAADAGVASLRSGVVLLARLPR